MNSNRFQDIFHLLAITIISGYILHVGSAIFMPIIFAILLSVFLNPLDNKIRPQVKIKWVSIVICFLSIIFPILLITTLFSFQFVNIIDSMPSIYNGVTDGTEKLFQKINNIVPFANLNVDTIFQQGEDSDIKGPLKIVGQGLLSTSTLLGSTGLVMIYTFLFLYYKESFKTFIIYAFEKENRPEIKETLNEIKETIQSYIGGLGLVVVILSVLNTIGLYLIGIEHAIFWGTLAGFLAIIPYIGTLIGGLLPFIYALSTAEASWQPYAVLLYYLIIQQVEGNFITPKIVGDKVDINPLFAIFALVFFGSFWGVGGIILALPLISITKIIFSYFGKTKALSVLMSSDISSKKVISEKNQNKKT